MYEIIRLFIYNKTFFFLILPLILFSCGFKPYLISTHFDPNNIPAKTDYSIQNNWASLPEKKDPADSIPYRSTLKNNQSEAMADVFFIHPTLYSGKPKDNFMWNATTENKSLNHIIDFSSILHQASIFNESCKIYAPRYRQAHYFAFLTTNKEDSELALETAYQDIKAAFEYYLRNFNKNRPIIIASHSQGAYHGKRLLQDYFDDKPLKKQLVFAYLVGYPIAENTFKNIPTSKNEEDIGTFASWNCFADKYVPQYYTTFGLDKAVCVNPISWKTNELKAEKQDNKGGVGPKFEFIPNAIDAKCHKGLLWVGKPNVKGGKLINKKIWHSADYNFFYLNIRNNVANRIKNFFKKPNE